MSGGDEFKVEEVITNYLTNALNHLDYDHTIEISCKKEGNIVKTTVFNTGDPIPEEDLDKVWVKFFKVDKARTREYGGSGIGLSIVKAIMDSFQQQCGCPELRQRCGILVHTGGRWKNGRSMIAKSVPEKGNTAFSWCAFLA